MEQAGKVKRTRKVEEEEEVREIKMPLPRRSKLNRTKRRQVEEK